MKKILKNLAKTPKIKMFLKRKFYFWGNLVSNKKTSNNIMQFTEGKPHLFGYYGKSMWNKSFTKCIYLEIDNDQVVEGKKCNIILKDVKENKEKCLFKGNVWNTQQGNMLQWKGPDFENIIVFNYFENERLVTKEIDIRTGKINTYPLPFYEFSNDGKFFLTLDFERLSELRPGYGYSVKSKNNVLLPSTAITYFDLVNNKVEELLNFDRLVGFKPVESMKNAVHKVNHIQISPDNDKFIFIHRWLKNGVKTDRLILFDLTDNSLKILLDSGMVSHSYWKNNFEIVTYSRFIEKDGYFKLNLRKTLVDVEELVVTDTIRDGHPIVTKDEKYMIFDTYPNFKRKQKLYIYSFESKKYTEIAEIYSNLIYFESTRVDLHPRLSFDNNWLSIDGGNTNKRQIYVLNMKNILENGV